MTKKSKNLKYYEAVGRRKEASARVRLYLAGVDKTAVIKDQHGQGSIKIKQGEIYVNGQPIDKVYPAEHDRQRYFLPLKLTGNDSRFAVAVTVTGGGKNGQLEAIINGLSRAIETIDRDQYRPILKKHNLLTRDARVRERRKVGKGGKARRAKQSPKR